MKKLLLTVISLGLFLSYANASCKDKLPNGNVYGSYCQEISYIKTLGYYYSYGQWRTTTSQYLVDTRAVSEQDTIRVSPVIWFASQQKIMYEGAMFNGIKVSVDVYALIPREPVRLYMEREVAGTLIDSEVIRENGYTVGRRYTYYIPIIASASITDGYDTLIRKSKLILYGGQFSIDDEVILNPWY